MGASNATSRQANSPRSEPSCPIRRSGPNESIQQEASAVEDDWLRPGRLFHVQPSPVHAHVGQRRRQEAAEQPDDFRFDALAGEDELRCSAPGSSHTLDQMMACTRANAEREDACPRRVRSAQCDDRVRVRHLSVGQDDHLPRQITPRAFTERELQSRQQVGASQVRLECRHVFRRVAQARLVVLPALGKERLCGRSEPDDVEAAARHH
jgi:hypothetical protein